MFLAYFFYNQRKYHQTENSCPFHRNPLRKDFSPSQFTCASPIQIKQKHNGVAPEGTNNAQFHTGRGRGRPRKEKPHNDGADMIQTEHLENFNEKANINQSQLGKELTPEMLEHESYLLSNVHFALKPRLYNSLLGAQGSESNNFNALSWYADKPCDDD